VTTSATELLAQARRYLDAKDFTKALPLLQKAADAGNANAMNNLGEVYYHGEGVAQDYDKTLQWYQKAADAGNAAAMHNLGTHYAAAQDYAKAREWYQKAADAGDRAAKQYLECLPKK
jgi:uncharacterized protein